MNKFAIAGSIVVLLGSLSVASAQPGPPSFEDLDTDSSGGLSQAEIGAMAERMGGRRGQNSQGRRGPDAETLFGRLDTDGDGSVSKEEFDARPRRGGRGGRGGEGQQGSEDAI